VSRLTTQFDTVKTMRITSALGRRLLAAAVLAAMGACALASTAVADPIWSVRTQAVSHVTPGATFDLFIVTKNVGDVDADGTESLSIELPAGMTGVSLRDQAGAWSCSDPTGASAITCTPVAPIHSPGLGLRLVLTTSISLSAAGSLRSTFQISGGGAVAAASTADLVSVVPVLPGFGVDGFDGSATDRLGDAYSQAAGTPHELSTTIAFNTIVHPDFGRPWPAEPVKDLFVDLPPGLVGNATVMAKCAVPDLVVGPNELGPRCPSASQAGLATVAVGPATAGASTTVVPVYNMEPPPGVPARFGMNVGGTLVMLDGELRSDGDYGLSVNARNLSAGIPLLGTSVTFWGVPADSSHDAVRSCSNQFSPSQGGPSCPAGITPRTFLRLPTSCTPDGVGLETRLRTDSWFDIGDFKTASFVSHLPPGLDTEPDPALWGAPQGPAGCDLVPFDPTFDGRPAASARRNSPSGFSFDLAVPQTDDPNVVGQADLKRAVVTLPEGVRVSPSSADGLAGCSLAQVALRSRAPPTCPDASKVGRLEIDTPLLEEPLKGSVYLATPNDNPSGTLLAIYLVAEGPGVIVKLAGRVEPDPTSGQLKTTFDNQPQLPFSNLHLEFDGGPRAPLVTPPVCGTYTTRAVLTGWNGKTVVSDSSFTIDRDSRGGACRPLAFAPDLAAGTTNPVAGKHSSFVLSLSRDDEDEELRSLSVSTPQGLLARVRGVPRCPAAQAAAGTCGEASRIGSVATAAGAGSNPFWLTNGRVYFGGPYKGAPFSLSIVVPAVAGPFDLGNVVVRAAIHVDRRNATLRVVSDPLPTVLQGITLQVREVRVTIDRKRFILNPTSCEEKQVRATVGSTAGSIARPASRFQVGECGDLRFRPRMTLRVGAKGRTGSGASTPLVTKVTSGPGQANLASVGVSLPTILNARLPVVTDACTIAQFNAGDCERARTGTAIVRTPLLDEPLRGGAYFVRKPSGRGLPNLVIALRGQVDVDLTGTVVIPESNQLSTVFRAVPDVPFTSFTLRLVAGRNGALGTAANLCSRRSRRATASIRFAAQNGDERNVRQRLKIAGCGKRRG
jgi:hypothetical protein